MSSGCTSNHNAFAAFLTAGLCVGIVLSYLPQHYRIINKNSSEGFSPWYLLLGSTSSASGMLNVLVIIMLQWNVIMCCTSVGAGQCIESLGGVIQVTLQWALFTLILVLFLIYFPPHLKYVNFQQESDDATQPLLYPSRRDLKSDDWRLAVTLAWVVAIHIAFETFVTLFLVIFDSPPRQVQIWATFLGVTSAGLAVIQYLPQLIKTYRMKLVGAISIPMMCIQSPGSILMVISIAVRPGTNWTSWITYATAGIMQASLLVMCIAWKARQARLHIDDFGNKLPTGGLAGVGPNADVISEVDHVEPALEHYESEERAPLLAGHGSGKKDDGLMRILFRIFTKAR